MPYFFSGNLGYWSIVLLSTLLGLVTQSYIKSQYDKWSRVRISTGETGADVARRMLRDEGATDVGIQQISGHLTDNYDPRTNQLNLSSENLNGGSVASVAVACHEAGHAVQHARGYLPVKIRTALVPLVSFTSSIWMLVFMAGVLLGQSGLQTAAIVLFAFSVLFQLVTLPVEIDASRRAVKYIKGAGLGEQAEGGARSVVIAAALTYVAAALVSVVQLFYYLGLSRRSR
jgi:Zn-dependent membrane protease YugP